MKLVCYRIDKSEKWKPFQSKMDALVFRLAEQASVETSVIYEQIELMLKDVERAAVALVIDTETTKLYGFICISKDRWNEQNAVMINWLSIDRDLVKYGFDYAPCMLEFVFKYARKWQYPLYIFKPARLDLVLQKNDRVTRKAKHFNMQPDVTYWGEVPLEADDG